MDNIFFILGLALIAASFIGYVSKALRQPLILAYIITGFLLGPRALNLISDVEPVMLLSEMGIAFLLFTVGLHLEMKTLKDLGVVSLFTGLGQVLVMTLAGFLIALKFGFPTVSSLYIGIAIAFSSTIIIVKLLTEKNELNSLHGRISIGFLIVQDFLAILALVMVSGVGGLGSPLIDFLITLSKASLFIFGVFLLTKYILRPIFDSMAKNQELLFLSSISYCFLLAMSSYFLGLSLETGAFLAGMSLASLPYNLHIVGRISPLRDFFIIVFFIVLGTEMSFSFSSQLIWPLILLSLLVLIGTPIILMILMGALGYRKRTSFLVGVTVAQISEFSLILVALGLKLGHITNEAFSLITSIGVITITVSAYMILYGHKMYYKLHHFLKFFERKDAKMEMQHIPEEKLKDHIIVVGYHRVGFGIVRKLIKMGRKVLVVDFDPEIIKNLMKHDIPCVYGDVADHEILERINIEEAQIVISTAPDMEDNLQLMKSAKELNPSTVVIIVAEHVEEALELYDEGADYVILPHLLGSHHASLLLEDISSDFDRLIEVKLDHIQELKTRKKIHPHHSHGHKSKVIKREKSGK